MTKFGVILGLFLLITIIVVFQRARRNGGDGGNGGIYTGSNDDYSTRPDEAEDDRPGASPNDSAESGGDGGGGDGGGGDGGGDD